MSADDIVVKYDVVIPDGLTEAEEEAFLKKAEDKAVEKFIDDIGGNLF